MREQNDLEEALKLAIQHHRAGFLKEAELIYRKILDRCPEHPETLYLLGTLAHQKGFHTEACGLINQAISLDPRNPAYFYNLGLVHVSLKQSRDAEKSFMMAVKLKPDYIDAYNNLGVIKRSQGLPEEAYNFYRRALQIKPCDANVLHNLGLVLQDMGDYEAALAQYKLALENNPADAYTHSNLLFLLSYYVLCPPKEMLAAHQKWDQLHGGVAKAHTFAHVASGDPGKRLRVGYVSPDLKNHVVSVFFEPLLDKHDRQQVEVFCYAEVESPDHVTRRLQDLADQWRFTVGMSDEAVARLIKNDGIDILVDLAGHTSSPSNRLKVFTYKPAPIQVAYLGYCTTTGLSAMDYWITDSVLHPEDTIELATEMIYRLPRCWLCYRPADNAPSILPRGVNDQCMTFGSLNDFSKLTPRVIARWSEILRAVPGSRLLLKARALSDRSVRSKLKARFAEHEINPDRLILMPRTVSGYLEVYNEVDIALDPFPRTGGGTTADALWMGVPVITLAGERFIERQGVSMLTAVGLTELIADSEEEYVAKAVTLSKNPGQLMRLRSSLRQRMVDSPLCDDKGLAAAMEDAFRDMWRRYLGNL